MRVRQARPEAGFDVGRDVAMDTDGQQLVMERRLETWPDEVGRTPNGTRIMRFSPAFGGEVAGLGGGAEYMNRNKRLQTRVCNSVRSVTASGVARAGPACGPARNV